MVSLIDNWTTSERAALIEIWSGAERRAWRVPDEIKPSEWAARYRFMHRGQTSHPGPWDNNLIPPLRAVMDLPACPGVVQVNVMKAAQVGVSEAMRNFIGWVADTQGDPVGLALPDKSKGRKIIGNRLIPMINQTPRLARHKGGSLHDLQKEQIHLARIGWLLHLMWSGSPSAMASDPMRYCVNDEVDKFATWAGAEAGPVELTAKRLRSYEGRGCQINVSTPTTRFGMIFGLWDNSDVKLIFFVPCPKCSTFQRLDFAQLRWGHSKIADRKKRAAAVRRSGVHYECIQCGHKIREADRAALMTAGRWGSEDGSIKDAEALEKWPAGTRLGLQLSALYCPWTAWVELAVEFLLSAGDLSKMFDFRTQTLGEPFEQQVARTRADFYADKCKRAELAEKIVPKWAAKVLCAIDSQHDHFWVVVRAWGPDMRSARVWHGRVETFKDLDRLLFYQRWRVQDDAWPAPQIELAVIDTGGTQFAGESQSRTMEIYRWVMGRRGIVRPIKGTDKAKPGLSYWTGRAFIDDGPARSKRKKRQELRLFHVCTGHFRDELAHLATLGGGKAPDDPPEAWSLNQNNDPEYNQHMANMNKIVVRQGMTVREEWLPVARGLRHDYHDCESYLIAAAYMAGVHQLPSDDVLTRLRAAAQAPVKPSRVRLPSQSELQDQALDSWAEYL